VLQAKKVFRTRNVALARELALHDADIARMNRRIFDYVVAAGERPAVREWAMFMVLVARALERISANAVDIGEQTAFVVTGHLGALAPDPAHAAPSA
jgi:phosphate transport system protein